MVVIVLTACPAGLRGHLTRWLLEISPGVYVGILTTRVRELAWQRVVDLSRDGRAIMIYSTRSEQRLAFKVHCHDWEPVDIDGIHLMRRPHTADRALGGARPGWSKASRYRKAARQPNSRSTTESE
ncbi:type I-E CRISPR-associated endoribonuclease Cas2 [Nocardia terpenica]|uniref:type I-E CRISPR-associated endoribonuclease Cas2e n=1 Tax=Nocardia terpenica TaxID=455432 RepID=UPI0018957C77|nr:type I-E CRISPR-associated endoribonuclease Cas2e [Nocardia terpenica]MBF6064644.1 type I-E CRISPR-associated endoribonuclease Cas2 [Nocardia terpenica]MBF6106732.1 type I-E CRISPR-associated endoribonuclease Cas2 [Nocardia terpenica]MBF6114612.1 type I-E CRISPR-associated endoribonuclease Cas2 [Nocardia terpenica]MBF6121302.1 type I-E CRISPR-associated endoribonuclease Cas2 [Nocardia terpenica]MBF6153717.1 type I-E CRISPR-associated endoribonuclease Cas2 [Nocardia terpenica]